MSASWGGVCSTLTIVNPILLLHAVNLSGESVISGTVRGVGLSGPCPEDLVEGCDGGNPQETAVCG